MNGLNECMKEEGGGGGNCKYIAKHEVTRCVPCETGLGGAILCGGGVRGSVSVLVDGGDQTHHSSRSGSCPVVF